MGHQLPAYVLYLPPQKGDRMYERYDEPLKSAITRACDAASEMHARAISSGHLLIGVLGDPGMAAVFEKLDLDLEEIRLEVIKLGSEVDESPQRLTFTPIAKKVLEYALREALSLGHNWVGPVHLVLALARVKEGVAARILLKLGRDEDQIRAAARDYLSKPRLPTPPTPEERAAAARARMAATGAVSEGAIEA